MGYTFDSLNKALEMVRSVPDENIHTADVNVVQGCIEGILSDSLATSADKQAVLLSRPSFKMYRGQRCKVLSFADGKARHSVFYEGADAVQRGIAWLVIGQAEGILRVLHVRILSTGEKMHAEYQSAQLPEWIGETVCDAAFAVQERERRRMRELEFDAQRVVDAIEAGEICLNEFEQRLESLSNSYNKANCAVQQAYIARSG